jgi:ribosomal protein L37AE/L43A
MKNKTTVKNAVCPRCKQQKVERGNGGHFRCKICGCVWVED